MNLTDDSLAKGDQLLKNAYLNSLKTAMCEENPIDSIAFPLISAGVFRGGKTLTDLLLLSVESIVEGMTLPNNDNNNDNDNNNNNDNSLEVFLIAFSETELNALNEAFDAVQQSK